MQEHTAPIEPESLDELLRAGIDAAKAGDRDRARDLLLRVVEEDEERVAGWLWLSGVVDTLEDREVCLENVLALDPANASARKGLAWVRAQVRTPAPTSSPSTGASGPASTSVPAPRQPLWEESPDPLLCPYCASQTTQEARRCPACGQGLWLKMRRRETHSLWLWNLMVVRFSLIVLYALTPILVLTAVSYLLTEQFEPLMLLPVYLGFKSGVAPQLARSALSMVPRAYLLPFLALSLYSCILLVGMYLRWRPVWYVLLGMAGVRFAVAVAAIALGQSYYGTICGGFGILLGVASFFIVLQVQDDFAWDEHRVYLQLDRKWQGGTARLERASVCAEQGMWALAALYLRAAVAKMPGHVAARARLARAYLRLNRVDLAQETLEEARQIDPRNPVVNEMIALLIGQSTDVG